jgi:hypothetical protein
MINENMKKENDIAWHDGVWEDYLAWIGTGTSPPLTSLYFTCKQYCMHSSLPLHSLTSAPNRLPFLSS